MDGRRTVWGEFHKLDGAGEASPIEEAADSEFRPCLPNPRCSHPKCPPAWFSPEDFPAECPPPECPPECPLPECPPPPPCCPCAGARRQTTQTKIGTMRSNRGRKPARLPMAFPTPGDPLPFYPRSGGVAVTRVLAGAGACRRPPTQPQSASPRSLASELTECRSLPVTDHGTRHHLRENLRHRLLRGTHHRLREIRHHRIFRSHARR
jgi:hypothetical protein